MKTKKMRLELNKTTVANLDEEAMASMRGGYDDPVTHATGASFTCYSDCWTTPLGTC